MILNPYMKDHLFHIRSVYRDLRFLPVLFVKHTLMIRDVASRVASRGKFLD